MFSFFKNIEDKLLSESWALIYCTDSKLNVLTIIITNVLSTYNKIFLGFFLHQLIKISIQFYKKNETKMGGVNRLVFKIIWVNEQAFF